MSKRLVILGGGESGAGTAVLGKQKGYEVFVSDSGPIKEQYKQLMQQYGISFEEKQHTASLILNAHEVMKSPGIPEKVQIVKDIRHKGIPIISEIEFASRYTDAKLICITGSNGKTTTTSLIYHMVQKAGLNAALAGNIGKSFALQVATGNYEYYILEISNFQLDDIIKFKPYLAILTNITPDHLDRYNYEFQNYINSKFRITENLTDREYFIYSLDDDATMKELRKRNIKASMLPFTLKETALRGAFTNGNSMVIQMDNVDFTMSLADLALKGKHNVYNSMAAAITGYVLGIRKDVIRESLMDFKGVEHRLESVMKVDDVEFINDSKATNVNSAWYALESMNTSVVWIAGGTDKGNNYAELNELVKQKVKVLICLTADSTKLHKAFEGMVETIIDCHSMEEAVIMARKMSHSGDTVLLSPACASFDLFENYEDRGRQFKKYVRQL